MFEKTQPRICTRCKGIYTTTYKGDPNKYVCRKCKGEILRGASATSTINTTNSIKVTTEKKEQDEKTFEKPQKASEKNIKQSVVTIEGNSEKGIKAIVEVITCFEDILPAIKTLLRKNKIIVATQNQKQRVSIAKKPR